MHLKFACKNLFRINLTISSMISKVKLKWIAIALAIFPKMVK